MNNNLNENIIINTEINKKNNEIYKEIYHNLLIVKIYKLLKKIIYIIFKLSCIFIIIQGIGIILFGNYTSIFIGLYVILFATLLSISDIYNNYTKHFNIVTNIPIINTYMCRSIIIFFLGHLSRNTYFNNNWNKFIQYICLFIFLFYIILFLYKKYLRKIKNKIKLTLTYIMI